MSFASYERAESALAETNDASELAVRGRLRRLLGRTKEARSDLSCAARRAPRLACAHAWLWEIDGCGFAGVGRAVALDPVDPAWRQWRGWARLARPGGGVTQALADFDSALALDGDCAAAWAGGAVALLRSGRARAALARMNRAVALEPDEGWLLRLRARARRANGDGAGFLSDVGALILIDEGLGDFAGFFGDMDGYDPLRLRAETDRCIARGERGAWLYALRGDCRRSPEIGDMAGALEDFETAASLEPDRAWTHAYLARARLGFRRADASDAIDAAVRLAPNCGWMRIWRGEMRRRLGDARAGRRDMDVGLRLSPDYELGYAWRGAALLAQGRGREALADLDLAARLAPADAWVRAERSKALRSLGRLGDALIDIETAHRANPRFHWCGSTSDDAASERELHAAVTAEPENAAAWAWRGDARRRRGDRRGALADLGRALVLRPDYALARAWRGLALGELGRLSEARRDLDCAVALDAGCASYRAWRGRLRLLRGDVRGGAADLRRAAALGPTESWILAMKGEAERRLGRRAAARRDLERALILHPGNQEALAVRGRLMLEEPQ